MSPLAFGFYASGLPSFKSHPMDHDSNSSGRTDIHPQPGTRGDETLMRMHIDWSRIREYNTFK